MKFIFVVQIILSFHLNVFAILNQTVSNKKAFEITDPLDHTCPNLLCKSSEKNCCTDLYCCEDITAKSDKCSQGKICIGSKLPGSTTGGIETCCLEDQCCIDKGEKTQAKILKGVGILWVIILPATLLICCGFFCFEFYMATYQSNSTYSNKSKFYRLRLLQRKNAENQNKHKPETNSNQQKILNVDNYEEITPNDNNGAENELKVNRLNEDK